MPQMMPLNWIMLFVYFIMIFFIINLMIYFNYFNKKNSLTKKLHFTKMIWKW